MPAGGRSVTARGGASLSLRDVQVVELVGQKKRAGVAMVAIVHDDEIRHLIADRIVDVASFAAAA